ncbi:MAG: hypothetical protein KJO43_02915, partial [Phycisphaerae bacterium]|nr:hypothetical protein [Phycisphaerae bacterium]
MLLPRGNPLFLLATVIAIAGLRPAWSVSQGHRPIDHHAHGEHVVHTHEHTHGTHTHSHRHHHHPNDPQDDGSDHHRDTLEDAPDAPKARWSAPRRVEIDAPPVTPAPHMLIAGTV